jgi:hypothetical protein
MAQKVSFPLGKKAKKLSTDLKGILKRFEGQKNARGQYVGLPWYRLTYLNLIP